MDTGAAVSILLEKILRKTLLKVKWRKTLRVSLRTYISERIPVVGKTRVKVQYGHQWKTLNCIVVKGDVPCLMGRDWLKHVRPNWREIGLTLLDTAQT